MAHKITSFDRPTLRALDAELLAAIESVCAKHGLKAKVAGGRFSEFEFTVKFNITVDSKEAREDKADNEQKDWNAFAPMFGMKPEWFGRTFVSGKFSFRVAGIKPQRSKFPVLAYRVGDNKAMLFPADVVRMKLTTGDVKHA